MVAIVIAVFALDGGGSDGTGAREGEGGTAPGADRAGRVQENPDNITEEVAQRPLWRTEPQQLAEAEGTVTYEGDGFGPYIGTVVSFVGGDVQAYTPRELQGDAVSIQGLPVVLVGRVESDVSVTSRFGIERELRVVGAERGYDAYIGTDALGGYEPGTVIVASGRVAAIGESESPTGRRIATVYFLSVFQANGGEVDEAFLGVGSGELRRRIRAVKR